MVKVTTDIKSRAIFFSLDELYVRTVIFFQTMTGF